MKQLVEAEHLRWEDVRTDVMSEHISRKFIVSDRMMIARILLKKGAVVPLHHHENEQITYILEGALEFHIDGRTVVVSAGEVLCIPSNVPHEAVALEDTVDLDVFDPPRQDWINGTDAYLRNG